MKSKSGMPLQAGMRIRIRADRAVWVLGLGLLIAYGGMRAWADHARISGIEAARVARSPSQLSDAADLATASDEELPQLDGVDSSGWSRSRILAYAAAVLTPATPEAVLQIPQIALEVPVYAGVTETNLNRGAAHIEGSASLGQPGNAGIAAHRDGFFRKLKDVDLDSEVWLELAGRTLRYRVDDIQVVKPDDAWVLAPTERSTLTLVTCYPFYFAGAAPERYIIKASLMADAYVSQRATASKINE